MPFRVYPILALGLLSFAVSAILVRYAGEAPGLAVAVWRTAFAALLLAPVALPRIGPEVRRFSRRDAGFILLAGVLLGIHFVAWIESLYYTSVASASVLVNASPLFLAILGYLFLGERLAPRLVAGIVLGVAGAVLIGIGDLDDGPRSSRALLGNGLALGAALVVSLYLLIGRSVRQRCSWLAYVFPLYVTVALTTLAMALVLGTPLLGYRPGFYGLCAVMALGPSIAGHGSLNYAVRYLPAALLGLLSLSEPVSASVAAYVLFGEVPTPLALGGMAFVLAGVICALWPRRPPR